MAALQPFTLGWFGGMLLQEILVILGMLRCILVHSAAAHRASLEESHHHSHHCLLSYWNTENHLHRLGSILQIYYFCLYHACTHAQHMHARLTSHVIVRIIRI